MAMSFSRPDPASPAEVAEASFSTGRRGFDQQEVREFLRMVAAELGRLQERERFLERELRTAQATPDLDHARLDDDALVRMLGEETARILSAARESANEIREKAEQSAARLLTEASDEVTRLREEAEIESSRRRADAANDAEAELSMAKQQGREMVNEARAYRERVLSELARRRELAREQIEQLVHGRDRLMQAFERARLVAVDVVAELQPLGEPDEYVNLQPTTGPVPVMVARPADAPTDEHDAEPAGDTADAHDAAAHDVTVHDVPGEGAEPADDHVDTSPAEDIDAAGLDGGEDLRIVEDAETRQLDEADETADADASDAPEGTPESAVDEPVDAETSATSETAETSESDGVVVVGDADDLDDDRAAAGRADESDESADATTDAEPGEGDDVVVDLFARLRADSDLGDESEAAADGTAESGGEAGASATAESADGDDAEGDASEADADDSYAEATVFEQRDADLTPLIVASAKRLKRVLADEQNEVLDALRRSEPVAHIDSLLPWQSEHAARYSTAIADDLLVAAQAGASLATPDRVAKLRKAAGREAVEHASGMVEQWLVSPLRERLERCIADGGGDNVAVTKKVRAVYREWKTQHIDEQLDDVVRAAHGRGVLAAIEPDTPVTWTPDPRFQACADCNDNVLAGAVAAGQPFPTGDTFAPAHPGCCCLLIPAAR